MNDKVAILLPIYWGDTLNYVKLSVESLMKQTHKNIEIIVLLDGKIKDEIEKFLLENKNLTIMRFLENRGLPFVLNDGLKYCEEKKYSYIARMDADDISIEDRIEKQLRFLIENPEIDVVGGAINEMDRESNILKKIIKYPETHKECLKFFKKRNPLAHPAVMFRFSFFKKASYYSEKHKKNQDTYLWYKGFYSGCRFANLRDVILLFRISEDLYNRRGGGGFAKEVLKTRIEINKNLNLGILSNIYSILYFIIMISPIFVRKFFYKLR